MRSLDRSTGHDDVLHGWNTQSSSQWDGFRHIRNVPNGFYDGVADEEHGIDHWARRGIAGRAVLCDVGRWRAAQGRPLQYGESDVIEPDDILATLEAQGSPLETGDVLLMRTGWTEWYETSTDDGHARRAQRSRDAQGTRSAVRRAHRGVLVGPAHRCDRSRQPQLSRCGRRARANDAEEVAELRANHPERMHEVFAHSLLLPMLGIPLGEMFDLSAARRGLRRRRAVRVPVRLRAAQRPARRRHATQRAGDQVTAMRDEPPETAHLSSHAGAAGLRDERCAAPGGSSLIAVGWRG